MGTGTIMMGHLHVSKPSLTVAILCPTPQCIPVNYARINMHTVSMCVQMLNNFGSSYKI